MTLKKRAKELRKTIEKTAQTLDDAEALQNVELYPEWHQAHEYLKDEKIRHHKILYKVLQDHTSLANWDPANSPSLYARVLIPDPTVIPDWEQPDSTNPYMTGDKVKHNGKTWISTVDNNVWEPGVYGWVEIE